MRALHYGLITNYQNRAWLSEIRLVVAFLPIWRFLFSRSAVHVAFVVENMIFWPGFFESADTFPWHFHYINAAYIFFSSTTDVMEGETLKNKWEVLQQHETSIFRGTSDVKRRKVQKCYVLHTNGFQSNLLQFKGRRRYPVRSFL